MSPPPSSPPPSPSSHRFSTTNHFAFFHPQPIHSRAPRRPLSLSLSVLRTMQPRVRTFRWYLFVCVRRRFSPASYFSPSGRGPLFSVPAYRGVLPIGSKLRRRARSTTSRRQVEPQYSPPANSDTAAVRIRRIKLAKKKQSLKAYDRRACVFFFFSPNIDPLAERCTRSDRGNLRPIKHIN